MNILFAVFMTFMFGNESARAFVGDSIFLPPHAGYRTTETANFVIIYPEAYTREARESAGFLEEAQTILTKAFAYTPSRKCRVILADNTDYANGLTSVVGLQGLVLFLTAPDPYSSIGEYDHWLRSLVIHEYAHYVTLEQTRGVYEFGRYLFGNLFFANQFWPTWIAEGMAVYAESVFTGQGRGHGTYYSTITRDALARGTLNSGDFLEFNQFTGPYPNYPFGDAAYFAGYAMIDEMILRHGANAPARFAEESSWRMPFFFNNGTLENISRDHSAESFQDLWALWVAREKKETAPELAWLKAHGSGDPAFVTKAGDSTTGTRLSPDGAKLAYTLSSGHERPSIYIADLTATRAANEPAPARKVENAVSNPGLAWSPDGQRLYYSKSEYNGPYALYSDLYAYDLAGNSVTRLTKGQRAKDPDYCATAAEPRLVYTTQRGQSSELRTLGLSSGKIETIYRAPLDHHVSNPRCAPDGRTVYFAEHSTTPLEAIYSVPIAAAGPPKYLFGGASGGFGALFPEPADDGGIYFTRVIDGFYDLARWIPSSGKIRLVARSSGGYWLPSLSRPGGSKNGAAQMSVSYISSTGLRAGLVDPVKLESAINSTAEPVPHGSGEIVHQAPKESPAPEITNSQGYNLLGSLAPRFWWPWVELSDADDELGALILGSI
ncbi:MAG: PD40 domain-containing protein [Deltaproteobacteria bacterium]|nr:PD40 domain-containing protein [Deltaproteobacteria bacterium]